ncbi:MAG: low molecular weight protein-tyrosine-phosphatase [Parasphingopyxis sp.]
MAKNNWGEARVSVSVLFVCLGNICRSPLAEGALRAAAERREIEIEIDSAGTGDWHVGQRPDGRAILVADGKGVDISGQSARQIAPEDFARFDHIVAMERGVLERLRQAVPADARAELSLFLDHVPGRAGEDVADPYYGDADGFENTWRDVAAGAEALIEKIAGRD